ncbi:MAG: hypothetical protein C0625_10110 [Arcobacter sp.]|nr:MAG: hypothetical protein C0625_10110 [Arcobacter sp.]
MIYSEDTKNPKIIKILILATIILVISILFSKTYDIYQVHKMNQLTQIIYNHPLKVSNEAQSVKINLYKMHRNMKDIILYPSLNEVNNLIKKNDEIEKDIYKSLNIIKKNILGEEGKNLEVFTRALFKKSKPIREKVIKLAIKGKYKEAI